MKQLILIFVISILLIGTANAVENSNKKTRRVAYTWSDKDKASNRAKAEYILYVFDKLKPAYMEKFAYKGVSESIITASVTSGANLCERALIARLNQINAANGFYLTGGTDELIDFAKALEIMKGSFEKELDPSKIYTMDGMAIDAITGKPVGVDKVSRKRHELVDGPEKGLFIKLADGNNEFINSLFCFNINAEPLKKKADAAAAPMMDFNSSEEVADPKEEEPKPVLVYKAPKKTLSETAPAAEPIASAPAPVVKAGCWDLNSNGIGDLAEDKNHDGVCNDNDCDVADRDDRKEVTKTKTDGGNITITIYNDRNSNSQPAALAPSVAPQPAVAYYHPAMNTQPYYGGGGFMQPQNNGWQIANTVMYGINTGLNAWNTFAPYFNRNQGGYCGIPQGNPWRGGRPVDRPINVGGPVWQPTGGGGTTIGGGPAWQGTGYN